MNRKWIIPLLVVVLAAAYLGSTFRPQTAGGPYDLGAFGRIPVTAQGRVKPLDTVARTSLLIISDRQTAETPAGDRISAIRWLADAVTRPKFANAYEVFRIDHPAVKDLIGVEPGEEEKTRFSFNRIAARAEAIEQQLALAEQVPEDRRNPYQTHLLELAEHLNLYAQLQRLERPYLVPPLAEDQTWMPLTAALHAAHTGGEVSPAAVQFAKIFRAYHAEDAATFNDAVASYTTLLRDRMPEAMQKAGVEVVFSRVAPFYQGTVLYVLAFLLACGSLLTFGAGSERWAKRLGSAAFTLVLVTFVIHTAAIGVRMYLQGRPPVTNLYSSAVFIGWVAVLLSLFIEWLYKNGLGTLLGATIGAATLIVAHNLAAVGGGDTMEMMQAVLDSNFWLATHVITITIGYAATFLAGFIGIIFILGGVYTRALTRERLQSWGKMMYGVIAFALLFSFVGTVLGGIWADQSWGRFWGWDPKENGAVLIVLMTALILHARWGGMIQQRGMAVLAVAGNIVTAWSWFGTNMLGVGLHSYGFMDSAMFWLLVFVVSQVAIIAVGLIPKYRWASFEKPVPRPHAESEPKAKSRVSGPATS